MKLNRKYIMNILIVAVLTVAVMYFSLKDSFGTAVSAISKMGWTILLVLSWGLVYTCIWGISYKLLGQKYKKDYSLKDGIIVAFVGTFFAGITPSSTGGQFGQAYVLKKQGISLGNGASMLWADFIIYQTTMMVYVTILFLMKFSYYVNQSGWFWLVFFGYIINFVVIFGLYTIALFPKVYVKLAVWLAKILSKFKFVKDPEGLVEHWNQQMTHFTGEVKALSQDRNIIFKCMLANLVRLTMLFALPWVIALCLKIPMDSEALINTLALSSFVTMANSFIPLPGASGGTEIMFGLMFGSMYKTLTGAVMLLWRLSSYYLPMIIGAVVFIVFKSAHDKKDEDSRAAAVQAASAANQK